MADVKVSALPVLAAGNLDPINDYIMVGDASAGASKRMAPGELLTGALPYLYSFLDFTTGVLPPSVSFTRASTGWRYNSAGLLVSAATDAPRFQYDPASLVARGLLIEEASTGQLTYSEQFDNVAWSKTRCSVVADQAVAPDGTTTMDKVVEDATATQTHQVSSAAASFTSGLPYVFSVYAKAGTRNWIKVQFPITPFGSGQYAYFDVQNGVLGTTSGSPVARIQNVGGGIFRCSLTMTATATGSSNAVIGLASGDGGQTYSGDGASYLYLWGANIQTGDCVTSYIQTTSASVTRAVDVAPIANSVPLGDQVYIVKARTPRRASSGAINVLLQLDDGSANNRRTIHYGTDGHIHVVASLGGVGQCDLDMGAVAENTDFTIAARFADNLFAASLNGAAILTDVSGTNPMGLTATRIGRDATGSSWNSTIKSVKWRDTATDSELPILAA